MNERTKEEIINQVVVQIYEAYPEIFERFGEAGKVRCHEDNAHHFLDAETLDQIRKTEIFTNYAIWLTNLLTARGMNKNHVIDNFQRIHEVLGTSEDSDAIAYQKLLESGIQAIQ